MTWETEQALAERLGITRGAIVDLRGTVLKKPDWRKNHRSIEISEGVIKKITRALGGSEELAPPPKPEIVELTVSRVFPNERLLEAETAGGERVRVRVSSNKNFLKRMKLKARPDPQFPGMYRLE